MVTNHPLYSCFIDYKAAFDSVDRDIMWEVLDRYGVPTRYINIIKAGYDGYKAGVMVDGVQGQLFEVKGGAKQGDMYCHQCYSTLLLIGLQRVFMAETMNKMGLGLKRTVMLQTASLLMITSQSVKLNRDYRNYSMTLSFCAHGKFSFLRIKQKMKV